MLNCNRNYTPLEMGVEKRKAILFLHKVVLNFFPDLVLYLPRLMR